MNFLVDLGLFALLFFLLVFVHELGHFLMAKWVGIRVEKFSIGMGPKIFSFQYGDTEYRLAWLPLGGYVKMAGDDPTKDYSEEERKVGFLTQKPPAKLLVVFGGPVFNLILPLFVFGAMLAIGTPTVDRVVGTVEEGGVAAEVGLEPGDKILSIDGQPIESWKNLEEVISTSAEKTLSVQVERRDLFAEAPEILELQITPEQADGKSRFGEDVKVGRIGISPAHPIARVYFEDPESPLARAGIQPFDQVVSANGYPIEFEADWLGFLEKHQSKNWNLEFVDEEGNRRNAQLEVPASLNSVKEIKNWLGILPADLVIGRITEDGAAAQAGMQEGDRLISIDGQELSAWREIPDIIRNSEGRELLYVVSRKGERQEFTVAAEKTTIENPLLGKDDPMAVEEVYRIGVSPDILATSTFFIEQSSNPVDWVTTGFSRTWEMASMTVTAIYKLVTGQLSLSMLGSPIMIYKVAGNTYRMAGGGSKGWIAFFTNLALLSITLGLVNLLPVPVLDGGHAVFFTLEALRGKPVSIRTMEIATQVGLVILFSLFALVLYNDFYRYGFLDPVLQFFQ